MYICTSIVTKTAQAGQVTNIQIPNLKLFLLSSLASSISARNLRSASASAMAVAVAAFGQALLDAQSLR